MKLKKLFVGFIMLALVSTGFGITFSDNVQATFVDTLSGNGLVGTFSSYDTAWNDAGTMAVVAGHESGNLQNAYAYFPGNDTYVPLTNYYGSQTLYGVEYSNERIIPTPDVLIVDADYNENGIANAYSSALSSCNANVVVWDVWSGMAPNMGKPNAGNMANYDVVIWVPSKDMNGLNGVGDAFNNVDEAQVANYLNSGGNFMLSNIYYTDYTDSGSAAYNPGDFAYDYFGINHITDTMSMYDEYINETIGDPVYDGIGSQWLDWWIYSWSGSPDNNDYLFPASGEVCFYGTDSGMGTYRSTGIRYNQGDFKSTFFGFPFEVISSGSAQESIMEKTLEWFMPGSQGPTRQSSVLIVDADFNEEGIANAYEWSIANNSWDVSIWDVYPGDNKPTSADMAPYDLVVWVPTKNMDGASGAGDAFNNADEGQVGNYLSNGGNFFLANSYWTAYTNGGSGTYSGGSFAYEYMGLDRVNIWDQDYEYALMGFSADDVFDGYGYSYANWDRFDWGGPYPWVTDAIAPMNGISCMRGWNDGFGAGNTVGVRYDAGPYKSMVMTFPFEVIPAVDPHSADNFWYRLLEWYIPDSTAWNEESFSYQDVWWVCGDDASVGWNTAYRVVPNEGMTLQNVGTANVFHDVAVDHLGNPLFVSLARNDMQYYDYFSSNWFSVTSGLSMGDYDFYGVDFNENDRRFYVSGECNADNKNTIWYTDEAPLDGGSAKAYKFNSEPNYWTILREIAWNQGYDYGLVVGDNLVYKVWPFDYYGNGTMKYNVVNTTFGYAYDVSWDTDGWNEAAITGYKGGILRGAYWRYYDSNPQLIDGYTGLNGGVYFYTCAMKPPSSPKWVLIPSSSGGVKINVQALDQSGEITVGADQPHVINVDMWKQNDFAKGSVLNSQVDADTTYTFFIEGNYTIGGVDNWSDLEIDLTAWYDNGNVGTLSTPGDASWTQDDYRNQQFNLSIDAGTTTDTMQYPVAGGVSPEFEIHSLWQDPSNYGPDNSWYHLYVNVTFGAQTFVANSNFATGVAARPWDQNFAHNDADSWDFAVTMFSTVSPTAINVSYEEFGINNYASVSVVGSPGGNAPPGTANFALATPSQIYYSTNSAYFVNVSIPHLYKGGVVGPDFIDATNVEVRNTHSGATGATSMISAQTSFGGPNTDLCVWGRSGPSVAMSPPTNGTESAGPGYSDYTADFLVLPFEVTEVYWWVTIPASTPEGTYRGTITISLWGG